MKFNVWEYEPELVLQSGKKEKKAIAKSTEQLEQSCSNSVD